MTLNLESRRGVLCGARARVLSLFCRDPLSLTNKTVDESNGSEVRRFSVTLAGHFGRFQEAFNINNKFL